MFDYTSTFDSYDDSTDENVVVNDETNNDKDEIVMGKVICDLLNIRPKPKKDDSDNTPLTTVKKDTELLIMGGFEEHHDWYSVCTPSGVEGYAMKKFVNLI